MTRRAYTRCRGLALGIGLLLPLEALCGWSKGPSIPPPAPGLAAATPAASLVPSWSSTLGERLSLELVVTADHVVTIGPDLPMTARSLEDGNLAWTSPVLGTTVAATPDTVFAAGRSQVLAVQAETGEILWSVPTAAPVDRLVAADDRVVAVSEPEVLALAEATGEVIWRVPLGRPVALAASGADLLAIAVDPSTVLSLDLASGAQRWRTALDQMPVALAVGPDRVYAGLPHIALCGLRLADGRIDWCTTQLRAPVAGPPLVRDDTVIVTQRDGGLRTLDGRTGTMRDHTLLRGRPADGVLDMRPNVVVPLVSDELALVDPAGRLERIPSPEPNRRSPDRTAVSPNGRAVVTLAVRVSGEWVLTTYRPDAATP